VCRRKTDVLFRAFCPKGWWAELNPRSSTFTKRALHSLYGIIDESYPREWLFACQHIPNGAFLRSNNTMPCIEFGDRIGQIVPIKRQEMKVLATTNQELDRMFKARNSIRKDGFGSTGK